MTLEQLLNKLIEKGWKPFGLQYRIQVVYYGCDDVSFYEIVPTIGGGEAERTRTRRTLRDVVSIDSLLWQFVCENGMVEDSNFYTREKVDEDRDWIDVTYSTIVEGKKGGHYQYRLIESALKDESELEDFLLSNIKIEG